jgi:translation initiation factor 6
MQIAQISFHGDHNLGLFGKSSDKICIAGNFVPEKAVERMESLMKVPVLKASIANTDFIGIFCCMNSNGLLLPDIVNEREIAKLKILKKDFGLNISVIDARYTALGNLILCNDKGVIISKIISKKEKKKIEDCLGVESEYCSFANISTVGSCGIATNKGCLLHRDTAEEEMKSVEDVLKVPVDIGTANFGSPFVGSCMITNSNGLVVGESTTGPEIARIMETLDFL